MTGLLEKMVIANRPARTSSEYAATTFNHNGDVEYFVLHFTEVKWMGWKCHPVPPLRNIERRSLRLWKGCHSYWNIWRTKGEIRDCSPRNTETLKCTQEGGDKKLAYADLHLPANYQNWMSVKTFCCSLDSAPPVRCTYIGVNRLSQKGIHANQNTWRPGVHLS